MDDQSEVNRYEHTMPQHRDPTGVIRQQMLDAAALELSRKPRNIFRFMKRKKNV